MAKHIDMATYKCTKVAISQHCRGGFVMSRWIYNPPRMNISICNA